MGRREGRGGERGSGQQWCESTHHAQRRGAEGWAHRAVGSMAANGVVGAIAAVIAVFVTGTQQGVA